MMEVTPFSYSYFYNACRNNEIVHIRVGKKYYINYDKFVEYLNQGSKGGEADD